MQLSKKTQTHRKLELKYQPMWQVQKQLRSLVKHKRTPHFSHNVFVWFLLQTLHLPLLLTFTGQCAKLSLRTISHAPLWIMRKTFAGISSTEGRPRFLAAFTLTRQLATSAWNRRRLRMDDFGNCSARQSRLYMSQAFSMAIVKECQNKYIYQRFDFIRYRYLASILSRRSVPPMNLLYSWTIAGRSMVTWVLLFLSHLLAFSTGSALTKVDRSVTALLSNHLTAAMLHDVSILTSNEPLPLDFNSFSFLSTQPDRRLGLTVPT